jgi:hypothetical protein
MKQVFSNIITISIEVVTAILAFFWLQRTGEEEPKIVLVAAIGALITSMLLRRANNNPKIIFYLERSGVQNSATRASRMTSRISQVGEMSGEKDITRTYNLSIVNNSNSIAFNPELYVHQDFNKIIFEGAFSASEPILPANRVEIQFKYIRTIEGSPSDFERETKIPFPKEFDNSFRLLLSYQDENGKTYYTTLKIENNNPENRLHTHLDNELVKVKVHKPLL